MGLDVLEPGEPGAGQEQAKLSDQPATVERAEPGSAARFRQPARRGGPALAEVSVVRGPRAAVACDVEPHSGQRVLADRSNLIMSVGDPDVRLGAGLAEFRWVPARCEGHGGEPVVLHRIRGKVHHETRTADLPRLVLLEARNRGLDGRALLTSCPPS